MNPMRALAPLAIDDQRRLDYHRVSLGCRRFRKVEFAMSPASSDNPGQSTENYCSIIPTAVLDVIMVVF